MDGGRRTQAEGETYGGCRPQLERIVKEGERGGGKERRKDNMNSAEAADEGPNDPDTDPFFRTGNARLHAHTRAFVRVSCCQPGTAPLLLLRRRRNREPALSCGLTTAD